MATKLKPWLPPAWAIYYFLPPEAWLVYAPDQNLGSYPPPTPFDFVKIIHIKKLAEKKYIHLSFNRFFCRPILPGILEH